MRLVVLGSGPGGYVAAIRASQLGAQVIIIDESEVGGTCLNWGCIPTKALIASSEALAAARRLESYGIEMTGAIKPNLSRMIDRKNKIVSTLRKGIEGLFKSRNIVLKNGRGILKSPREITVMLKDGATEHVGADCTIIATGSRPADMPAFPFDGMHILSSTEALDLREIPKSVLIIGAGVIGCEFACIFRELGSEVTMVEALPRAIAAEDPDLSGILEAELKKKKIKLITGTTVLKTDIREDGVHALLSDNREVVAEKVLVSVGRRLNIDGIGIDRLGIRTGTRGEIVVNDRMETNVPGIYAVGDITGGTLLAHKASAEGMVAAANIMGTSCSMDYGILPAAIFTSPEIASVGLREQHAADQGISYKKGVFPFRALGKAHAVGNITGMVKILSETSTDRIIGAHIIGPHAADLIHEATVAMKAGLTARDLAGTIHAHPTFSESLMEAAEDLHGSAIHLPKQS